MVSPSRCPIYPGVGIFLFLILIHPINAQKSTARFLLWQPSAVSHAMGGVGTAMHEDAFAMYYNPSALAFSRRLNAVGSLVKPFPFFGNTVHSFIGGLVRIKGFGTLAFSANLIWKGEYAQTDDQGNLLGAMDKQLNAQYKLAYALPISDRFSIGTGFSLFRFNLSDIRIGTEKAKGRTTTLLVDIGVLYKNLLPNLTFRSDQQALGEGFRKWLDMREPEGISLGAALLNLGPSITLIDEEQSDPPPTKLKIGAAYWPYYSEVISAMFAADIEKQLHEDSNIDYLHAGAQLRFFHLVSLRAGRFIDTAEPKTSFTTVGGGIHTKFFSFNIARYTRAFLASWHYDITLSLEI